MRSVWETLLEYINCQFLYHSSYFFIVVNILASKTISDFLKIDSKIHFGNQEVFVYAYIFTECLIVQVLNVSHFVYTSLLPAKSVPLPFLLLPSPPLALCFTVRSVSFKHLYGKKFLCLLKILTPLSNFFPVHSLFTEIILFSII